MDKPVLRAAAMLRRDALDDRERRSAMICALAIASPAYIAAQAIHCYLPMRSEVDTRPLIADALARGKRVAVPIVVPKAEELAKAISNQYRITFSRPPRLVPPKATEVSVRNPDWRAHGLLVKTDKER